jgi:translation initiation factor 1
MSKNKKNRDGVVYSTDPEFNYNFFSDAFETTESIDKNKMMLRVSIDRKQRGGKEVTLITGFRGTNEELESLGKLLKNKCGVGGSAKENEIILQGNHKEKVIKLLIEMGYTGTKGTGG